MKTKALNVRIKAAGEDDGLSPGRFRALVSVFGNVDSYGDMVMPGAFTDNLKAWADSGDPIPVVWSHRWEDPMSHIGVVTNAVEVAEGLEVEGDVLDIDTNPVAAQVWRLLKGRRVRQFSFAYDEVDAGPASSEELGEYRELRKLNLHEVGPCLLGVNPATELLEAKAHELAKAGRVLSAKNRETIVAARDALNAVLETADDTTDTDTGETPKSATIEPNAAPSQPAATEVKAEDRETGKVEEPRPQGSAMVEWDAKHILL